MQEYNNILAAMDLLQKAQIQQAAIGHLNPAWVKLYHARTYLSKQLDQILADETL